MHTSLPQSARGRSTDQLSDEPTRGSIAGWSLALLLATAAVLVPVRIWVSAGMTAHRNSLARLTELRAIQADTEEVLRLLADDSTPEGDSYHDEVWSGLQSLGRSGKIIALNDLSSSGSTRVYTNVNSASTARLRIALLRRGLASPLVFDIIRSIEDQQRVGRTLSDLDLRLLLGGFYSQVVPFVDHVPETNVNLAPRQRIIEAIARVLQGSGNGGAARPRLAEEVADRLILERDRRELSADLLGSYLFELGIEPNRASDLGARTWVWEMRHRRAQREFLVRVVRLAHRERPEYKVISAHWEDWEQ